MKELYRKIDRLDPKKEHELITVTGGKYCGLHLLMTQGEVVWSSDDRIRALPEGISKDQVFWEKLSHSLQLIVCGCGFVGQAVISLAHFLGWKVSAVDDREEYTRMALHAGAGRVFPGEFREVLKQIASDRTTCYVIVTRDHQHDRECLHVILGREYGYIGMMGSHHRARMLRESLREEGVDEEKIASIHAPIGLPIRADTPEEIAVSIIAQIIQAKEKLENGSVFPEDLKDALRTLCAGPEHGVLAVITSRKGSTPRMPGARMLVFADGKTVGTIGGGLMEAEVIRSAVRILEDPSTFRPHTMTIDLTGRTQSEERMVCGGMTEVFLELL